MSPIVAAAALAGTATVMAAGVGALATVSGRRAEQRVEELSRAIEERDQARTETIAVLSARISALEADLAAERGAHERTRVELGRCQARVARLERGRRGD